MKIERRDLRMKLVRNLNLYVMLAIDVVQHKENHIPAGRARYLLSNQCDAMKSHEVDRERADSLMLINILVISNFIVPENTY